MKDRKDTGVDLGPGTGGVKAFFHLMAAPRAPVAAVAVTAGAASAEAGPAWKRLLLASLAKQSNQKTASFVQLVSIARPRIPDFFRILLVESSIPVPDEHRARLSWREQPLPVMLCWNRQVPIPKGRPSRR